MAPYSDLTCVSPIFLYDIDKLIFYDYIMKAQALNADKVLIESVIVKLTLES